MKICDSSRVKVRSEGMQRAMNILSVLAQRPENAKYYQCIHLDLISAASYDEGIAGRYSRLISRLVLLMMID
jgi:hypothetical protein